MVQLLMGQSNCRVRYFYNLLERDRGWLPCSNRRQEIFYFGTMTLVLAPQPHFFETFYAITFKGYEIIQLQYSVAGKNLQPLFGKTPVPIGKIMNGTNGTISKGELNGHCITGTALHACYLTA